MRILVFCEFPRVYPWSPSAWAGDLVRGLARRGHDITVACDGAEDPASLAPARVLMRAPFRHKDQRRPLAFLRFARRTRRHEPHDASLSLTRLAPADVWVPIGPTELGGLAAAARGRSLISAGFELAHRLWLPEACLAERLARLGSGCACRARLGDGAHEPGVIDLGTASRLDLPAEPGASRLRRRTRDLLGLGEHRAAILLSVAHATGPEFAPMLEGLGRARRARSAAPPVLLVAGHRAFPAHDAAVRAGCAESVRLLGATARMDAALAASDAAAAGFPGAGASARFVADALRAGRPVLVARDAPGASLVAHAPEPRPGLVVEDLTAAGWHAAFERLLDPGWRAAASLAARALAPSLAMDALVERLERLLIQAHAHRHPVPSPATGGHQGRATTA